MPSLLIERGMAQLAGRPFLFYTQSQHRVFLVVGSIVPLLNTRLCSSAAKSSYINAAFGAFKITGSEGSLSLSLLLKQAAGETKAASREVDKVHLTPSIPPLSV